tara:strand:+ start:290 stop:532 length:243 start_codon:yes stop_codon:yes gene_type:complete
MGDGTKRLPTNDKKVKTIKRLLDNYTSSKPFKNTRSVALLAQLCVMCENPNLNFIDTLSEREYKISGMCQNCQDNYFKEI